MFWTPSTFLNAAKNRNARCLYEQLKVERLSFFSLSYRSFIMKARLMFITVLGALMVFVFTPSASFAQTTTTGTVEGTVTDPNGAVVPNASITLSGPNLVR